MRKTRKTKRKKKPVDFSLNRSDCWETSRLNEKKPFLILFVTADFAKNSCHNRKSIV